MLERKYDGQTCSIARALEVVGDRWTLLILRETGSRARRFDELQASLGLARNVLTERLVRLCDDGLLERQLYQERPARYAYAQTPKARDVYPVLTALLQWGDKYYAPNGPPREIRHCGCGGHVIVRSVCSTCGTEVRALDVETTPGPGARSPASAVASPA